MFIVDFLRQSDEGEQIGVTWDDQRGQLGSC